MSDRVHQCPFINRADSRCSQNMTLERLQYAFSHCFGTYHACPSFVELMADRKMRRGENVTLTGRSIAHGTAVAAVAAQQELVQVHVSAAAAAARSAGYSKRTA
jgi:hypothetical protein